MKATSNPGATEMKTLQELRDLGKEVVGVETHSVEAVTLKEILDTLPDPTVIIKLDIEGFECKVLSSCWFRDLPLLRRCLLFGINQTIGTTRPRRPGFKGHPIEFMIFLDPYGPI